jgi:hypothetical protein
MNTKEKYEDIKVSMLPEKTRDTLDKIKKATKDFSVQNDKADAYVSAVHSKLKKEKPSALRSEDKKPEPKPEPKKAAPKPKPEPKPKPQPKPKPTKTAVKATTTKVNALTTALQNDPLLKGLGKTDKERDAGRRALPAGRRVSKKGWKNQHGTSKGGRVYYENRENRSDRKSPDYKGGYPYLAMGGYTHKGDEGGEFYVNIYTERDGKIVDVQEREYRDKDSAMTFAMMKGNFLNKGQSVFVMNEDGDVIYKKVSMKAKGGYMAHGGKVGKNYAEWEMEVTQTLADKLGIDYGDASGIVEAQPFYMQQSWTKGLSASETADVIDEKSVMAKGGYMAKGGEVKTMADLRKYRDQTIKDFPDIEWEIDEWYETAEKEIESGGEVEEAVRYGYEGIRGEITSYLEENYSKGGYMAKGEDYEYKNTFKRFDSNVPVPQDDFKKFVDAWHKQKEGDKLDKAKYKVLKRSMGNYLGHKTVQEMEDYVEKTHKGQRMAKGGLLKKGDKIVLLGDDYEFVKYETDSSQGYDEERIILKGKDGVKSYPKDMVEAYSNYKMAKGGLTEHGLKKGDTIKDNLFWENAITVKDKDGKFAKVNLDKGIRKESMAKGGKIGFDALAAKVAKRYEGKKVPAKYQKEYGKTYDKQEAQEVGDKVAAKVYRQQLRKAGKMAEGGELDQGFNDRLDESMGNRNGKESKMDATLKDRRNEAKGENKAVGKRPYSSVHTMDKMAKGGKTKKYDYAELEMGIRTEKKEHGMTKAKATQTAKDHLDEDSHYYTKMKAAGLAEGGELGKINLPHNLKKYFTKPAGTIEVEMNKLIPIRAREKGIANAERYMRLAYDGKMERRKPITIYKSRNGKYRIKDGNSTFAVAKKHNWKTIWAEVVENPNISKRKENSVFTVASKIRKDGESWASAVKRAGAMNKK